MSLSLPPVHPTVAGPPEARPIVFLHGMTLTRAMWVPQMEALADQFRVISLDLPGHGELADMRFSLEAAAEVVREVVDREAGGRATVVGLSMGGYVALEFAHRHPERTAGLILASCSAEGRGPLAFPYHAAAWLTERPTVSCVDALNLAFIRLCVPPRHSRGMLNAGSFAAAVPDVVREITHTDWTPKLATCPGPVLILNGQLDYAFRKDEKRWLAAAQRGRLQIIPWAGHFCNMHRPEQFTEAVRGFASEA